MSNKVRVRLLVLISAVWALNTLVMPVLVEGYTPDPAINGIFMLAAGAVYAQRPSRKPTDSE